MNTARVTGRHALLFEPFREFSDCFAGRIGDLPRYNLWPEFAIDDYPQDVFPRACAVLRRMRGAGKV